MNVLEEPDENTLIIELIHVDTSFVNALRRIILSEIPTVALEQIYMWNNSSIIHDEVLAHRLGLIPIQLDARYLDDIVENPGSNNHPNNNNNDSINDESNQNADEFVPTDRNTVVFRLAVSCPSHPPKDDTTNTERSRAQSMDVNVLEENDNDDSVVQTNADIEAAAMEAVLLSGGTTTTPRHPNTKIPSVQYADDRPYTKHIYSSDLIWVPQGDQEETLPLVKPIHDDILIAKLRGGQTIELEAHARKGIGKDHAKYSPVATASYRLMPKITILQPIYDTDAEELVHIYEPGVFDLISTEPGTMDPIHTKQKARLINPYACTMSRNYMRQPVLEQSIQMTRISDHFIFSIESVGAYRPGVLLAEAIRSLQRKCHGVIDMVNETTATNHPLPS
jgi:DNA-directed RNA polymerases I and III subunit RPAC1